MLWTGGPIGSLLMALAVLHAKPGLLTVDHRAWVVQASERKAFQVLCLNPRQINVARPLNHFKLRAPHLGGGRFRQPFFFALFLVCATNALYISPKVRLCSGF